LWLAGYGAFVLSRSRFGALAASVTFYWIAFATLAGVLGYNRWRTLPYADYWIALAFAAMLPRLAADRGGSNGWRKPARYFGATSYTLYLFHFPLLAFLAFAVFNGRHWQPGMTGFALYLVIALVVLGGTHLAWWLFERRTDDVRSAVGGWFRTRRLRV
jgi:peptidoglycan/LPS O-acetylase OafA/YrhL